MHSYKKQQQQIYNTRQEERFEKEIHYVRQVLLEDGTKKTIEITREQYNEAVSKNDPTVKILNGIQIRSRINYENTISNPEMRRKSLEKRQKRSESIVYCKKVMEYGLTKIKKIDKEEYLKNKDDSNFFELSHPDYRKLCNDCSEIYLRKKDKDEKKLKEKEYKNMSSEELNQLIKMNALAWGSEKRGLKRRNKNRQSIPTHTENQNPPQNSPTISPANVGQSENSTENQSTLQQNLAPSDNNIVQSTDVNTLVAQFPQFSNFTFFVHYNGGQAGSQQVNNNNGMTGP